MRFLLILPVFALTLIFIFLTEDCSGNGNNATYPRRTAYPRIELYDTTYHDADARLPLTMMVNDSATVVPRSPSPETIWIDVIYPRYSATMRLTISRVTGDSLATAIANRHERIALNAGYQESTVTTLQSPGGLSTEIVVTPGAMVTPLQIISTDSSTILLTGALEIHTSGESAEYYTPILKGVERDLIAMARQLELK